MTTPRSLRERAVFADTSALFALLDRRDRWHDIASETFNRLARERRPLFTSNLVVAETYILAREALGHTLATAWLVSLDVNLVFQTESDHQEVSELLARYADRDFSYADALSFVLIERLGLGAALTFDSHFRQYGVAVQP